MKSSIFIAALSVCLHGTLCAQSKPTAIDSKEVVQYSDAKISREKAKSLLSRVQIKRTGGNVRKPNSAKGYFVLLNAQKKVPREDFSDAVDAIDAQVHVQTRIINLDSVTITSLPVELSKVGGNVAVALVDDPTLPALLAAPEEGWGLVNVAKLEETNKSVYAARTRREIMRAFGMAGGAMYAAQGDFVLLPIRNPSELDNIKREQYGAVMINIFKLSLPYFGITPWYQTTYLKACEEGWAAAPTNEFQKAIWDKVHEPPKNPMKIEFDPKKGR